MPWLMSNRQPWVEALIRGLIRSKTRSMSVHLPPVGATVWLHASKMLWSGYDALPWVRQHNIDVPRLPRGGVVAVATVAAVGRTRDVMPPEDRELFRLGAHPDARSCAGPQTIVFDNVRRVEFVECRGAQTPTCNLPTAIAALQPSLL